MPPRKGLSGIAKAFIYSSFLVIGSFFALYQSAIYTDKLQQEYWQERRKKIIQKEEEEKN